MLKHLKTNTAINVLDKGQTPLTGMQELPAFKDSASSEIIATRDIPASVAYSFVFKQEYPITHFHYLKEGDTLYRVVGVDQHPTPHGAHTEVHAEMKAGT
jgi:hypothetical protein